MNLFYNNFALHNLGDFTVSSEREYESASDAPQRIKVRLRVKVELFESSYADNYDLLRQLREALATQHGTLQWTDTAVNKDYFNQTATLVSHDLPEEWGELYQQSHLVFEFYEQNLVTNNLPLTFLPAGGTLLELSHVTGWQETTNIERFNPLRSHRQRSGGRLSAKGMILADATQDLATRRAFLKLKRDELLRLDAKEGVLKFGSGTIAQPVVVSGTYSSAPSGPGSFLLAVVAGQQYQWTPSEDLPGGTSPFLVDGGNAYTSATTFTAAGSTVTFWGNAGSPVTDTLEKLVSALFFDHTVRIEEFTAEIDQAVNQIGYSFTASYTRFPNEASYATVEFDVVQRDANTGEQFLELTGKIMANAEAAARAKLSTLTAALLTQYGYAAAQPLRNDTTSKQVSANSDGDTFLELSFSLEYRRWRDDNQQVTFKRTGSSAAIDLGNVRTWTLQFQSRRFSEMRSQRANTGGRIDASGTWKGDPTASLEARRAAFTDLIEEMASQINGADGLLVGLAFSQIVRVETFRADINQAITGIDWSLTATYSLFPNESGYATAEFSATQREVVEEGDQFLLFAGRILAPDEALARAKLTSLRTTVLGTYGYTSVQQIRQESAANAVFANGDKTASLSGNESADGTTFIELTFTEEYRRRNGSLLSWNLKTSTRDDVSTGLRSTVYAGTVTASGSTVDNAYAAAFAQAETLGAGKETQAGSNAFLRGSQINWDQRQSQASSDIEFVRLEFSYEYQSKIALGQAYLEVTSETVADPFGLDTETVSGFVVAVDFATAISFYQSQVRSAYNGSNIRGERTSQARTQAQRGGTFVTQQTRLEFTFQVYHIKTPGKISYRYGITVTRDFLLLSKVSRVHGSVFALSRSVAEAALEGLLGTMSLGSQVRSDRNEDREYTSDSADEFLKLDFDEAYADRLTGISGVLEMRISEKVQYSGPRWISQPTLTRADGTGGFDVPQAVSTAPGSRTVEGYVSGADRAECEAWARRHRDLLTGDADGGEFFQPERIDTDFEFVPRIDGIAVDDIVLGQTANVQIWRVSFAFAELLPNYPAPA